MIAEQLDEVRRRIDAAAYRSHRDPGTVTLIAVSKTFPASAVREAASAGQRAFGENRVQEGLAKIDALREFDGLALEWHLIGHLQTNKARKAAAEFQWIHSVDSVDLVRRLDAGAADAGTRPRVLVQVDLAHEATKHGADALMTSDVLRAALEARALDLRGLMIVPPVPEHPEDSRAWFRQLRELRDRLIDGGIPADRLRELSMGMSHNLEVAVEEGATMVRVGTAIFGVRS